MGEATLLGQIRLRANNAATDSATWLERRKAEGEDLAEAAASETDRTKLLSSLAAESGEEDE